MRKNYHTKLHMKQSGMTLIELLVVLAIFILVAGLTIFDYSRFRSSVSLQNLADDIALSVRRAQGQAIGVGSSLSTFANGYGVHFSTNTAPSAPLSGSNKSFVLFNDIPNGATTGNKLYDYNGSSTSPICDATTVQAGNECIDLLTITSSDEIAFICPDSDPSNCGPGSVDIVFLRPNPDAYICAGSSRNGIQATSRAEANPFEDTLNFDVASLGGTDIIAPDGSAKDTACLNPLRSVDIVIRNTQSGDTKTVTVSNIGQISVK